MILDVRLISNINYKTNIEYRYKGDDFWNKLNLWLYKIVCLKLYAILNG